MAALAAEHEAELLRASKKPVSVTAIHLYREGTFVIVAVEVEGAKNKWVPVIREYDDINDLPTPFSHIVEASGIRREIGREP